LTADVLIEPDCSAWRWKDEDEFDAMIQWGLIEDREAEAVRFEAAAVIRRAENIEPPFCEPWGSWQPDPAWQLPSLPPDVRS